MKTSNKYLSKSETTQLLTDNSPAGNRVDGLTGFFTDEVRLSHHCTYGSRIQRFIKLWSNLFVVVE